MTKLLLASLLFTAACSTTSSAHDARTTVPPPSQPQGPVCVAGQLADRWFVVSRKTDVTGLPTSDLVIASTGAWRFDQRDGTGNVTTRTGCLTSAQLPKLRGALRGATWKVGFDPSEPHCMAHPADYTEYMVNGMVVYSYRMCDGGRPDQATTDSLAVITEILRAIG
jgi:hypothetical protein